MMLFKIILFIVTLVLPLTTCCGIEVNYFSDDNFVEFDSILQEAETLDPFEYAEAATGISAELLRGIAAVESDFDIQAVGDGGLSHGMFQLHDSWHNARVEKWGNFNPEDPYESAVVAGRIIQENLEAFNGDIRKAVAAYKQGVTGVKRNGVIEWYVDDVLNWRSSKKTASFYLFCGIIASVEP